MSRFDRSSSVNRRRLSHFLCTELLRRLLHHLLSFRRHIVIEFFVHKQIGFLGISDGTSNDRRLASRHTLRLYPALPCTTFRRKRPSLRAKRDPVAADVSCVDGTDRCNAGKDTRGIGLIKHSVFVLKGVRRKKSRRLVEGDVCHRSPVRQASSSSPSSFTAVMAPGSFPSTSLIAFPSGSPSVPS